jgi:hypothetical protein
MKSYTFSSGEGTKGVSGCWMTYGNALLHEEWGDVPCCVDPLIRHMCMAINDSLSNDRRTEIIDKFGTWLPFNTKGTIEDSKARIRRAITFIHRESKELNKKVDAFCPFMESVNNAVCQATLRLIDLEHEAETPAEKTAVIRDIATQVRYAINYSSHLVYVYNCEKFAKPGTTTYLPECIKEPARAVADDYVRETWLPFLKELIEMGPHCPSEPQYTPSRCKMIGLEV